MPRWSRGHSRRTSLDVDLDKIPNLPAARITSGILDTGRIPDLSATKITSDVLGVARIPDLDASQIYDRDVRRCAHPGRDRSRQRADPSSCRIPYGRWRRHARPSADRHDHL